MPRPSQWSICPSKIVCQSCFSALRRHCLRGARCSLARRRCADTPTLLIQARRFDEADRQIQRAITIDPDWRHSYSNLRDLYVEKGEFDKALTLTEERSLGELSLAYVYARQGDRKKALELLNARADQELAESALVYAALDDFDNAFRVINLALDRREGFMFGYGNFLVLDKLKSDPRWAEVSRRINLPPKG